MTPADLRQMIEAATPGPDTLNSTKRIDLMIAIADKSEAILALWEAAQAVSNYPRLASHIGSDKAEALRAALAGMEKP